ncbi:Pyruvate kinase [Cynara cardunculus var. scolymus]|uniref:Pyruvate kinase n=1 Tax=Cynara cardunculus var. scolymus TaxID=59895 RepID=A0A118JVJ3_CYNCS|nr:Pyruvate kinase [Cynara cardunculus var. scolymus]
MAADLPLISPWLDSKTSAFGFGFGFGVPVWPMKLAFNEKKLNGLVARAVLQVGSVVNGEHKGLGFDRVKETELMENGFLGMRKTKMVCTVGPSSCSYEELEKLALGGMNVARLNMCHNTKDWHQDVIRKIKKLNQEKGFCVSVMIDTEGRQIHVVDHGASSSVKAEDGSIWFFTTEKLEGSRSFTVQTSYEGFNEGFLTNLASVSFLLLIEFQCRITEGDELVVDGGMATFQVIERIGNDLRCSCTDPGLLLPRAKLSLWRNGKLVDKHHELPTLSAKDWSDIEFGTSEGVDFIAVSFVNDAAAIKHLKDHLLAKNKGDLGVEIPLEQVPTVQEEIIDLCRRLNKPVIVASQLLESMIEYPTPTRAEVADVSEAVRQCADALMLSGESAMGSYGLKAISVLRMASTRMELWSREVNQVQKFLPPLGVSLPDRIAEQICNSNKLEVDAIFVYTKHGEMASLLSRNRPNPPIFAFTNENSTRMALNLQRGVVPIAFDLSDDMDANISRTTDLMKAKGMVNAGDAILVVSDVIPACVTPAAYQSLKVIVIE